MIITLKRFLTQQLNFAMPPLSPTLSRLRERELKLRALFSSHLLHFARQRTFFGAIRTIRLVSPAKAGIHFELKLSCPIKSWARNWIPAFAGMTV